MKERKEGVKEVKKERRDCQGRKVGRLKRRKEKMETRRSKRGNGRE